MAMQKLEEDFYSKKEKNYFNQVRKEILPLITGSKLNILEVGCGTGATLKYLKDNGIANYISGIEIDSKTAEIAKNNLDNIIIGNIEEIELDKSFNKKFDVILFLDVLEHMVNPWEILSKVKNYLNKDGYIIISIPNIRNLTILKDLIFKGDWHYTSSGILDKSHLRFFTRKTLLEMISDSGYVLLDETANKGTSIKNILFNIITFNRLKDLNIGQFIMKIKIK